MSEPDNMVSLGYCTCDAIDLASGEPKRCQVCGGTRFREGQRALQPASTGEAATVALRAPLLRTLADVREELREEEWGWAVKILDAHQSALDALREAVTNADASAGYSQSEDLYCIDGPAWNTLRAAIQSLTRTLP